MPRQQQPAAIRWVGLPQLASEVGFSERTLIQIRTTEPGVLVSRQNGQKIEYLQPDCAVALRKRERAQVAAKAKPSGIAESEERKAAADAELAEVKLARLRDELAPRSEFAATFERLLGACRQEVQAMPLRHGPRVVGLTTTPEGVAALREIATELLAAMAAAVESLDEPEAEPEDDEPEEAE